MTGARPLLESSDAAAVRTIADFLDEIGYGSVASHVGGGSARMFFAPFVEVQELLKNTSPFYRLVFSLLAQGHGISDPFLRAAVPSRVVEALRACRVITQDADRNWHTTDICIVSIHGLHVAVSLPPHYPTTRDNTQPVFLGVESLALAEAMPGYCGEMVVLDMCAGSAVHGLLAAARGAAHVVAIDIDPAAVAAARFNAGLNRLGDRIEVRQGDLFEACAPDERFDLIVANPPSWPSPPTHAHPRWGDGGADGAAFMRRLLPDIPARLAEGGTGLVTLHAFGGASSIHVNEHLFGRVAEMSKVTITSFVHSKRPLPQYAKQVDEMLDALYPGLSESERVGVVQTWLQGVAAGGAVPEFVYSQIVRIDRDDEARAAAQYVPTYPVARTDPLVGTVGVDL